jgi:hypothetical protein
MTSINICISSTLCLLHIIVFYMVLTDTIQCLVSLIISRLKLAKCTPTHPVSLKPLNYWDRWNESRWWHGVSSLVLVVCFVGNDFCDELITCTQESYRVRACARARARVCVCVCVWLCVMYKPQHWGELLQILLLAIYTIPYNTEAILPSLKASITFSQISRAHTYIKINGSALSGVRHETDRCTARPNSHAWHRFHLSIFALRANGV